MTTKSVLLKLTPETHAAILEAAKKHKRSMHSLLTSLIEQWLASDAPDPLQSKEAEDPASRNHAVDEQARESITRIEEDLEYLHGLIDFLASTTSAYDISTSDFPALDNRLMDKG